MLKVQSLIRPSEHVTNKVCLFCLTKVLLILAKITHSELLHNNIYDNIDVYSMFAVIMIFSKTEPTITWIKRHLFAQCNLLKAGTLFCDLDNIFQLISHPSGLLITLNINFSNHRLLREDLRNYHSILQSVCLGVKIQ